MRVLAVVAVLLVLVGVGWSDVYGPQTQWMKWNEPTFDPPESATGVLVAFKVELHEKTTPNTWTTKVTEAAAALTGQVHKFSYDLPIDGKSYEFRTTTTVIWPGSVEQVLAATLSGWKRVPTVTPGGCFWEDR